MGETKIGTKVDRGGGQLTPQDVKRLFDGGFRDVEVLDDGTLREKLRDGGTRDDIVTGTLKTSRPWY
jgi:hypothetical protein